jgi:predicted membrane protein
MNQFQDFQERRARNKIFLGIAVIIIGIIVMMKQLHILPYFHVREVWPFVLIAVGIFIGLKNRFHSVAPFILIGVGLFHLIPAFSFNFGGHEIYSHKLAGPIALICIGIVLILRHGKKKFPKKHFSMNTVTENILEVDVVFGGRKEFITAKDFQGGRVTATFGGAEINLLSADSSSNLIELEVRATFGGVEIIVPANWNIKNQIETAFGSVEDQRRMRSKDFNEAEKTLVLKGSCTFGGVEIKSF